MRSFRRVTQRVAPALASIASVLLFATCDFDKISGTPTPISQADIDRLFSITPTDTTVILGGTTTLNITPGANVDLTGTTRSWTSSAPTIVAINEATGVASGVAIGNAVITARLLAPELDSGYSKTRALRVRYKGIKACASPTVCSPATMDSIAGLNLSRAVSFFGTNNSDQVQATNPPAVTITTRDSGATTNTVVSVTGTNVFARKNGAAYVIGVFETMRDSIKVKVRQVAKSLTFPTTEYTANSLNANRTVPLILKDVNDSVMLSSPLMRWRSSDTTVFTIDSITGILRVKKADTARIIVRVDTIFNKTQKLRVDQALAGLTKFAGDAASDTVARVVTTAPTVTAVDSGNTAIVGDTVIFRVGSGAGLITDSVKITDVNGRATVGSWQLGAAAAAQTLIATSGTRTATFTVTGLPQRAFKLGFGVQPRATATAASIAPAVTVSIRDSLNNLVTTATDSVFIAIGNNPSAATLSGTRRAAAVAGVATFSNLALSAGGSAFTLAATSAGALSGAISDAFDIFGTATKLGVVRQPVSTSAGAILDTIQIAVQDAQGTIVSSDTRNVTIAIGTNPASGALTGTVTAAAVGGIATFTNLSINNAGTGYTLSGTATGLTATASTAFNVAPVGAAARLAFTTQPANFQSGATPTLAVTVQDANGATVTSSTIAITLALTGGTTGAAITGTPTRNAVNGVATFPAISVNLTGTGYKFSATSASLSGVTAESNLFNVTPGTATKLGFITQPTHSVISTTMSPSFTIAIQDVNGNTVTGQAATAVGVAAQTCTGGTIAGTTSVNTASGVATFSAVTIGATQASACTLLATSTGLTSATSTAFNMVATTGAIRLVFGTQPTTATAGNSIPSFTVRAVDASGTTVATSAPGVTLTVLSGPGTIFSGSAITASSGIATFSSTQIRTSGTYKLLATSSGFKADSSVVFIVNPGTLSKVGFVNSPTSITAGVPFSPTLSASYQDSFGNTITGANGFIELGVQSGPGGGVQVEGIRTVETVNGVATFPGLTLKKAFTGYTLFAAQSGGGLIASISGSFNVTAGPLSALTFTNAPSANTAGNTFSATVQAADSVGNAVSSFSGQITLGLTGGNPTAALLGTTTGNAAGGVVSFSGLSIQKSGTGYQLSASASGVTTGSSSAFTVSAGNATKLGWITQPTATFLNAPLAAGAATQPQIAIQDQFGNTSTASQNSTIRLFVSTGPNATFKSAFGNVTQVDVLTTNGVATLPTTIGMLTVGSYTMLAQSPFNGFTQAVSNSFTVAANDVKSKLTFSTQPTGFTYGAKTTTPVVVQTTDAWGNLVSSTDQVTIALGVDGNPTTTLTGGGATAAVSGNATFPNIVLDKAGAGYTLVASASGLTSATSNTFAVASPGIVTAAGGGNDMLLLNNTIYFTQNGNVKSVPATGGTVTTVSSTGTTAARLTASPDGANVYWNENDAGANQYIKKLVVLSNTVSFLTAGVPGNFDYPIRIYADANNVYFTGGSSPVINSVSVNTSNATPTPLYASGNRYLFVNGGFIYFVDNATSTIQRMATTGGTRTTLTTALTSVIPQFAMSGTTLYFTDGTTLKSVPNANTATGPVTPTPLTNFALTVYNLTIDGSNMYVKLSNVIRKYALTDFNNFTLMPGNTDQWYDSVLLDGTNMFFNNASNQLVKQAK